MVVVKYTLIDNNEMANLSRQTPSIITKIKNKCVQQIPHWINIDVVCNNGVQRKREREIKPRLDKTLYQLLTVVSKPFQDESSSSVPTNKESVKNSLYSTEK